MANVQNLRPGEYKLTHEEQKRGGKASAESRRRKKNIKECMRFILDSGVLPPKAKATLEKVGVDPDDLTYNAAVAMSMINKALQGDVQAAKLIIDLGFADEINAEHQEKDPLSVAFEKLGGNVDGN